MTPQIDLFHELVYRSPEGFVAIRDHTDYRPNVRIYTPDGECFGSTGASHPLTVMANIREIIAWRINWEQNQVNQMANHEFHELNE